MNRGDLTPDAKAAEFGKRIDSFQKLFQTYEKLISPGEIADISPFIRRLRMVKSSYEISLMSKAAEMGDRLFQHIPEFIEESETETDLAIRAETFYRRQGHPGFCRSRAFNMELVYGHIMAGSAGAVPSSSPGPTGGSGAGSFYSQGAGSRKIGRHEPILVDYTANWSGYLSDQARIYALGRLPEKFYRAHQVMLEVQDALARDARPGQRCMDLYAAALKIVKRAGLQQGFMGYPQPVAFVGHGLGLELDELPVIGSGSDIVLEEGVTIALEPKFIFPGEGVVGIENTYVVTNNGVNRLNTFPDEITSIP